MSHFTVLVCTPNGTDAQIKDALQPFHEFECTDTDDKYVRKIDKTAERVESFNREIASWTEKAANDPDYVDRLAKYGENFAVWLQEWNEDPYLPYNEMPQRGKNGKHRFGYYTPTVPTEQWTKSTSDTEVVRYTNPDKKWDWWEVGGRWSDMLINAAGAKCDSMTKAELNCDAQREATRADRAGYMAKMIGRANKNSGKSWGLDEWDAWWAEIHEAAKSEPFASRGYNVPRRLDHLIEAYRYKIAADKLTRDLPWEQRSKTPPVPTKDQIDAVEIDFKVGITYDVDGKEHWFDNTDPIYKAYSQHLMGYAAFDISPRDYASLQEYIDRPNALTYALLYNGKWATRGAMGWFGMSHDEDDNWDEVYYKLLDEVPDDWHITVVDCHI